MCRSIDVVAFTLRLAQYEAGLFNSGSFTIEFHQAITHYKASGGWVYVYVFSSIAIAGADMIKSGPRLLPC